MRVRETITRPRRSAPATMTHGLSSKHVRLSMDQVCFAFVSDGSPASLLGISLLARTAVRGSPSSRKSPTRIVLSIPLATFAPPFGGFLPKSVSNLIQPGPP